MYTSRPFTLSEICQQISAYQVYDGDDNGDNDDDNDDDNDGNDDDDDDDNDEYVNDGAVSLYKPLYPQ